MGIEGSRPRWQHDALAATLLLCMAALMLWRQTEMGPTVDEIFHLTRGLAWWWEGTGKLSYAHPPLANVLMTAPAAATFPPLDIAGAPGWDVADHSAIAQALTDEHYAELRPMLLMSRVTSTLVGLGLGAAVYAWTSRRIGAHVGLVALAMVAFNPTILAHAQLVTTDLPVALTVFLSVTSFIDYVKPPARDAGRSWLRWVRTLTFGLAVGAALITKFTAITFIPFFAIAGVVWAWRGWGRFAAPSRRRRLLHVARDIGVVAVIGLFLVNAAYRFEDTFWTLEAIRQAPEPQCYLTDDFAGEFLENRSILAYLPGWLLIPVPFTWIFGLEMVRSQGHTLHPTWFFGFASSYGNPAYFPVLFLLKTPVVVTLGLGLGFARWLRNRRWPAAEPGLLLGAAGLLLALLMTSMLNIGFRHALPIVPLLSVLSALSLVRTARDVAAWGGGPRRHAVVAGVVVVLLATAAAACVSNAGRYLSYFNVGRGLGERVSIVGEDWGQDTIRLARVVKERGLLPLRYHSFGMGSSAELRYQGVDPLYLQPCRRNLSKYGWLAVHAANYERYAKCFPRVTRPPDLVVAGHIYLWELTPPESRDRLREMQEKRRPRPDPGAGR